MELAAERVHANPPLRSAGTLGMFLRRSRATGFCAGATLSSRSKMIASASLSSALAILRSLSAGTNSQLRGSHHCGLLQEKRGARAFADQLVALVEGCGDAQVTSPAFGRDLLSRTAMHSLSERSVSPANTGLGNFELVVAEIGDEGAERGVVDADSDQQAEGEAAVDERLAELGLGGGLVIEVERLRIVGERRDQDVVGLGDRSRDRVRDVIANLPFVEETPGHALLLGRQQKLGNGLGDRGAVEAIGGVEIGEVAGLAELLDAERRDALAEDAAEPRERGGSGVGEGDEAGVRGEGATAVARRGSAVRSPRQRAACAAVQPRCRRSGEVMASRPRPGTSSLSSSQAASASGMTAPMATIAASASVPGSRSQ